MNQLAPVRPAARPSPRRATTPTPRQLKVVAPPETRGSGVFLTLCALLLLGGFVGVLMLNTAMAKGSYTMRDLQRRSDALTDQQDSLRHAIDSVSGPGPLAQRAQDLGMVPAETAAFLRLSDGKVLGVATKAKANDRFSVVTESTATTRRTPVTTPAATAGTAAATTQGAATPTKPATSKPTTSKPTTTKPTASPTKPADPAPAPPTP